MDELQDAALRACAQAHAPYSGLHVGAALRSASGQIHLGCNVESAAFPVGGCAEHHAIAAAVQAEGAKLRIVEIAVTACRNSGDGSMLAITPCGACRQLIFEFGRDAMVRFKGADGQWQSHTAAALLPHAFMLDT